MVKKMLNCIRRRETVEWLRQHGARISFLKHVGAIFTPFSDSNVARTISLVLQFFVFWLSFEPHHTNAREKRKKKNETCHVLVGATVVGMNEEIFEIRRQ